MSGDVEALKMFTALYILPILMAVTGEHTNRELWESQIDKRYPY